jgi:hypothetical protein
MYTLRKKKRLNVLDFGYVRVRLPLVDSEAVEGGEDAEDKLSEVGFICLSSIIGRFSRRCFAWLYMKSNMHAMYIVSKLKISFLF